MTKEESIRKQSQALLERAADLGLNVTITRAPDYPLAMGHVRDVIDVWPLRQLAEPINRTHDVQHLPPDDTEGGAA
jgi:hypothetical protein